MKINLTHYYGIIILIVISLTSCLQTEHDGFGRIPDYLYDFLDSITDTIQLYNSNNDCLELINYNKQLITENTIFPWDQYPRTEGGPFLSGYYFEYDSYYTYFRSDSVQLKIKIGSVPDSYYWSDFFSYTFMFDHHKDSTMVFVLSLFFNEYDTNAPIVLSGNGNSSLTVHLSEGILSLTTKSGLSYQHVPYEEL